MNQELKEKVDIAIQRLQSFAPKEGQYYLAFSGGKDSVVIKALCDMAGVKYEAHYRVTSVDPPELAAFIREYHPDVHRDIPRYSDGKPITMWNLIPKNRMMPTRMARFCCKYLKEDSGDGKKTVTGVRWAESTNRKLNQGLATIKGTGSAPDEVTKSEDFKATPRGGYILTNDNEEARRIVEHCYRRSKTLVNPIIDWSDRNVWDFIHEMRIPYCKLYDEGFKRLGCIGCPMATTNERLAQFRRWPQYERLYKRAIVAVIDARKSPNFRGKPDNRTADEMWNWWLELGVPEGQIGFDEIEEEDE